jgi:cell division protease FtsH
MKKAFRRRYAYMALALVAVIAAFLLLRGGSAIRTLTLSRYQADISSRSILNAVLHDDSGQITGQLTTGQSYQVAYPSGLTQELTDRLVGSGAKVSVVHSGSDVWGVIFGTYGPVVLLGGLMCLVLYLMFSAQGGSRVAQFGKSKARTAIKEQPKVTFADVAGADEAVAELQEIKEFLESPARFQALGAKIPKGVLLFGPPGTGKTLLARAVAGEAGVPFFSISGSDFVEMFVGVGASRVRDLFEQAKNNAPSIVFMDEIDAVGRHRGAGLGGGHDEREQTLNQLLVEMDGFDVRGGVILIAATNRPDILDPALLRPGRFDRQIVVDRPDLSGRRRILEVHAKGKPLAGSADLDVLAKRTPGFTGADLANLLNEAAILTARRNLRQIGMRECEEAIDRVLAGPERKTLVMNDHDKLVTAYHEAGHAIVGHVLRYADPIHKVSIVARSRSLGLTYTLPEDRFNHSRSQLRDSMAMCLGGRTAEEIVFDEPTTGAENDIEKVTRIARSMVTEYGMSEVLGPQQYAQRDGEVFLGRDLNHQSNHSEEVASAIDREIRRLIAEAHQRARAVLARYRSTLDLLARELVEKETLDSLDLAAILGPITPRRASGRQATGLPGPATQGVEAGPLPVRRPVAAAAEPARLPPAGDAVAPAPGATPTARPGRSKKTSRPAVVAAPRVPAAASRRRPAPLEGAPAPVTRRVGRPPAAPTPAATRRSTVAPSAGASSKPAGAARTRVSAVAAADTPNTSRDRVAVTRRSAAVGSAPSVASAASTRSAPPVRAAAARSSGAARTPPAARTAAAPRSAPRATRPAAQAAPAARSGAPAVGSEAAGGRTPRRRSTKATDL